MKHLRAGGEGKALSAQITGVESHFAQTQSSDHWSIISLCAQTWTQ